MAGLSLWQARTGARPFTLKKFATAETGFVTSARSPNTSSCEGLFLPGDQRSLCILLFALGMAVTASAQLVLSGNENKIDLTSGARE
jgi:hypothetical protein